MPTDPGGPITPDTIDEIYRDLIQPMLFDGSSGVEPAPTLVLLGAQPGSGKSRASARLLSEHDGMIALSGDDLRIFHPHYRTLITDRPQEAGAMLAEATRTWVRRTIKDALDQRRSLLLEGTFGDPDVTLATAARFRESGFQVRIVAIASPRVLSVVTAASRYLRDRKVGSPARFTSLSAHDRGYDGTTRLVDSVDAGTLADGVTVLSRNGATLFDRVRDAGTPAPFAGARTALYEGRHPASWGA
ncbi:MAG: zeta toxin family protein, partial [Rhodoglobus sp.]|nr:zeta toxin family protein [Rhodoglobus sp.]